MADETLGFLLRKSISCCSGYKKATVNDGADNTCIDEQSSFQHHTCRIFSEEQPESLPATKYSTTMKYSLFLVLLSIAIVTSTNRQHSNFIDKEIRKNLDAYLLREERRLQSSEVVVVPEPNFRLMTNTGCFWSGTSPFCNGRCGKRFITIAFDKSGDGIKCWTGTKKLCCPL